MSSYPKVEQPSPQNVVTGKHWTGPTCGGSDIKYAKKKTGFGYSLALWGLSFLPIYQRLRISGLCNVLPLTAKVELSFKFSDLTHSGIFHSLGPPDPVTPILSRGSAYLDLPHSTARLPKSARERERESAQVSKWLKRG